VIEEGNVTEKNLLVNFSLAFVYLLHAWFASPRNDLHASLNRGIKLILALRVLLFSHRDSGKRVCVMGRGDKTYMLESGSLVRVVAVGHQERVFRALKSTFQRLDIIHVGLERLASNVLQRSCGGAASISSDCSNAVRVLGFFDGFDDGSALNAC
jgi:hypothetical protein